jgi:hypothetical protein
MHGHGEHASRGGKSKPIPALLMKRKAPEPQSA